MGPTIFVPRKNAGLQHGTTSIAKKHYPIPLSPCVTAATHPLALRLHASTNRLPPSPSLIKMGLSTTLLPKDSLLAFVLYNSSRV
jgi:hypothetical protein